VPAAALAGTGYATAVGVAAAVSAHSSPRASVGAADVPGRVLVGAVTVFSTTLFAYIVTGVDMVTGITGWIDPRNGAWTPGSPPA
jgi:hypothetical protein